MEDLVSTLTTGLIISIIFIAMSYFFWKKFDKPTPLMIEREEERRQIKQERRMWRKVEQQMKAEEDEAEERAAYERRKAEERSRSIIPEQDVVASAWSALGVESKEVGQTEANFSEGTDANEQHRATSLDSSDLETFDDTDVLHAQDIIQVRQDKGVVEGHPDAPDWELIQQMMHLGQVDEEQRDALPEAPDLPDLDDEAEEQTEEEMVPPLQTEDEMNQVKIQEHLLDAEQDTAEDEEVSEGPIDEITESEGEDHDTDTTTEGLWPQQLEEEKDPQEQPLLDEDDEWSAVNW